MAVSHAMSAAAAPFLYHSLDAVLESPRRIHPFLRSTSPSRVALLKHVRSLNVRYHRHHDACMSGLLFAQLESLRVGDGGLLNLCPLLENVQPRLVIVDTVSHPDHFAVGDPKYEIPSATRRLVYILQWCPDSSVAGARKNLAQIPSTVETCVFLFVDGLDGFHAPPSLPSSLGHRDLELPDIEYANRLVCRMANEVGVMCSGHAKRYIICGLDSVETDYQFLRRRAGRGPASMWIPALYDSLKREIGAENGSDWTDKGEKQMVGKLGKIRFLTLREYVKTEDYESILDKTEVEDLLVSEDSMGG